MSATPSRDTAAGRPHSDLRNLAKRRERRVADSEVPQPHPSRITPFRGGAVDASVIVDWKTPLG